MKKKYIAIIVIVIILIVYMILEWLVGIDPYVIGSNTGIRVFLISSSWLVIATLIYIVKKVYRYILAIKNKS